MKPVPLWNSLLTQLVSVDAVNLGRGKRIKRLLTSTTNVPDGDAAGPQIARSVKPQDCEQIAIVICPDQFGVSRRHRIKMVVKSI
jgi:hypothetical protein